MYSYKLKEITHYLSNFLDYKIKNRGVKMKNKQLKLFSVLLTLLMIFSALPIVGSAETSNLIADIPAKETTGATFRLGVVSDAHLDGDATETKLTVKNMTKALSTMQNLGVDALVMDGDMVYNDTRDTVPENLYSALKGLVETNGTFTLSGAMDEDGKTFVADTTDGKKPIIYSMGNHEFPLSGTNETLVAASKELFTAQTGRKPAHVMKINGYTFIAGEPLDYLLDYRITAEEFVMNEILEAEKDGTNKPIFYLQHEAVYGTVIESPSTASDNTEEFKNFLQQHPRVVVFSGHSHAIIEDPRTIWQDGFTAIANSQIGGGSVSGGSASDSMGLNYTGSQAIMMDLTEKTDGTDVSVYRLNLLTNEVIGTPFEFTIDGTANETFVYNNDRYNAGISKASFKEGSTLTINSSNRQGFKFTYKTTDVVLTEGADAAWLQDNYVHAYRVVLKNKDKNVLEQNFRVFSDIFEDESSRVSSKSVTFSNSLNMGTNYELSVYALTPFTTNIAADSLEESGVVPVKYEFKTATDFTDAEKEAIAENGGINVALNKTVYTAASASSNKGNLVNGKYNDKVTPGTYSSDSEVALPSGETVAGAANQGGDWFMIDLGRRYNIAKVKAWPSSAASNGYMMDFAIQVSNVEDFSDYEEFGRFSADVNNTTPQVFDGDGGAYRYVRMKKTKNTYFTIGELEVFAKVETPSDLVGPKVISASRVDDKTIALSFADKIDEGTLLASGAVLLRKTDGTVITPSSITLTGADEWDGGYDATISFSENLPSGSLTLEIAGSVGTITGTTFVDTVELPIAGKALAINKSYSKKRTNVNVAKGKAVYAGNTNNQEEASKLVDGLYTNIVAPADSYSGETVALPSGNTTAGATSNADDWFVIDLLRRYKISEIVVHPRSTSQAAGYMHGFVIEGSNDESFANAVPLGKVENNDPDVDGTTAVSFDVGGAGYRYIRLRKTVGTYHVYSEIEVFADMTITDVARGKSAETRYYLTSGSIKFDGKYLLDGNTTSSSYGWRVPSKQNVEMPNNTIIDLGSEYPLETAEIYSYQSASVYKRHIDVYGYSAAAGNPGITTKNDSSDAVKLFGTGSTFDTKSKTFDFRQGSYQYVVLSKTADEATWLTEFKAFVVNPEAYSAVVNDNNTITISFTDKMEIATLIENNFTIDGVALSNPHVTIGWDGGYDVTFDYDGTIANGQTLTISDKVRNLNGIEMASAQTLTLEADTFTVVCGGEKVEKIKAGASHDVIASYVPSVSGKTVLYVALKSGNALVSCARSEATTVTAGEIATITVTGVIPKAGEKLCIYLWEDGTLKPVDESLTLTE